MNRKRLIQFGDFKSLKPSAGGIRMRTKASLLARYITGLKRHALGFLAALAILFAMSATAAAATCNVPTLMYPTIQSAVNDSSCNPIIVAAGTYPEPAGPLTIHRTVTLQGAQAGVDARGARGPESIITDPQGTIVTAINVVIDGFTVQDSVVEAFTGYGIDIGPVTTGTQILNNIIQNNIAGIGLGGSNVTIRHNLIRNNNVPGPATGQGIYTDQFVGGAVVSNVLVEENTFSGHTVAGIDVSHTNAGGGVFNLDVDTNLFDMNGRALLLFNTHDSTIHDNDITNSTEAASAAIRLLDNITNLSILRNDLMTGAGHAIRLTFTGTVGGPSSGVQIHFNNIEVYALTGLTVDVGSHVGTVNAECNWWNSPSGPTNPSNPGGTGEEVVGDADFTPWLLSRFPAPCIGGLPPGKVTGGGQVNVPNGRGSFGFNARFDGGPGSGHLNYLNHFTGARLDCTVTAVTMFNSMTAEFSGPCSANSAATSFMAHVEDHGEPGKGVDKFTITYNAMTEGGTLTSGNIQIHK